MSLAELTKEQKQYFTLGLIGGVIVIILAVMGIRFSLSSISEAKLELADLTDKINAADKALSKRSRASEDYKRTVSILKSHLENIPPEKNYYSWATEIIYSNGRNSDLEIESVDEIRARALGGDADDESTIKFESYSLRIVAHGSFEQVKGFLKNIEKEYPLVRFSGIDISSGSDVEAHNVQLFIQWPFNLGQITKVWEEVESQQLQVAKSDSLKPEPVVNEELFGPDPIMASTTPAPAPVKPAPVVEEPKPVVAKVVPDPEPVVAPKPKPVPVKPVPVVEESKPVVAKVIPDPEPVVAPKPKPAPVKPAPVVEDPKPVVAKVVPDPEPVVAPKPKPAPVKPAPVVEEPKPVVAKVVPDPEPVVAPKPKPVPVKPAPVVEESKPVVAKVISDPEPVVAPKPKPAPVKPAPVVEEPKPVVAKVVPNPEPAVVPASKSTPEKGSLDSVLEALAGLEKKEKKSIADSDIVIPAEPMTEKEEPENKLGSLLASLGSRGEEKKVPEQTKAVSSDPDELEAFVKQLAEKPIEKKSAPVKERSNVAPAKPVPAQYASSGKSAEILASLLSKDEPKEHGSLSTFLDGLVEDIND
jgi:hypothetical protein